MERSAVREPISEVLETIRARCAEQGLAETWLATRSIRPNAAPAEDATRPPQPPVTATQPDASWLLEDLPRLSFAGEAQASSVDFEVIGSLGQGGMGVVRLVRQHSLDRVVAIKTLRSDRPEDSDVRSLLREARISGALEHPNIVPVHQLGRDADGRPQMIMKRVEGTSWAELLERRTPDDLARHLEILRQVARAAHFAHSHGVLHRDIKPENVMVGSFGEVYLLDWGLALRLGEQDGAERRIVGTPAYMAPEMVMSLVGGVSERTDVFLLGATLHHVLTGRPRHEGSSLHGILFAACRAEEHRYDPSVPAELASICNRACARDPSARYESVEAFQRAIADYLQHRASIELTRVAEEALLELRAAATGELDGGDRLLRVHRAFGQCRFGFGQALREWPENHAAQRGLSEALERMIEHEIAERNQSSARALLAELPEARPDLEAKIDALRKDLEAQEDARRKLERLRTEMSFTSRDWRRALAVIGSGVVWSGALCVLAILVATGSLRITPLGNLVANVLGLAEALAVGFAIRRILTENKVFWYLWLVTMWIFVACIAHRAFAVVFDTPFETVLVGDFVILLAASGIVAMTMLRGFWWIAGAAALGATGCALFPSIGLWIAGATILVVHVFVAWIVRPTATGKPAMLDV